MKFIKNEKGFTLIDIIVALIIILLFMSLISIIFFNITKTSKEIERESQATYIATNIMEAYKSLKYENVLVTNTETNPDGITILDGTQIGEGDNKQTISILDGYSAKVKVVNYAPAGEEHNDLVKKITVTVKYKVANKEKSVQLEASISRK